MKVPLINLSLQTAQLKPDIISGMEKLLGNTEFAYGSQTPKFEKAFASLSQTKYAVGVRSGTAALIIALRSLDLKPSDEVITTPATFAATADAIVFSGAKVVFADVSAETGNIDPSEVVKKVTAKTKGIVVVHLYGVPCDMSALKKICRRHSLWLVEDASHAHGSKYKGKAVGSFGISGCFSLYPAKTLGAIGNAGVITTNNNAFANKVRALAHHGITREKYHHSFVGYNELIDTVQSMALNIKMKKLAGWIKKRFEIALYYNQIFLALGHPGMVWPKEAAPSLYLYSVQLKNRQRFSNFFAKKGIQTGIYYPIPLHLQESMVALGHKLGDFPRAETFFSQTLSLPLYPELTDAQIEYVGKAIRLGYHG